MSPEIKLHCDPNHLQHLIQRHRQNGTSVPQPTTAKLVLEKPNCNSVNCNRISSEAERKQNQIVSNTREIIVEDEIELNE